MSPALALSICIPTYNRAPYLRQTLEQLRHSLSRLSAERAAAVEIIVLDNASTDDTAELVAEFMPSMAGLRGQSNDTNIGVERNIVRALQLGRGAWVWPLGDDDFLADDALGNLLDAIDAADQELGLLLLNYGQLTQDGREMLCPQVCDVPADWQGSLFGERGLHKFRGAFDLLAFISAIIVRRSALRFDTDYAACNSFYGHIGIIAASVQALGVKVLGPGTMMQRQGNTRHDADNPGAVTVNLSFDTFAGMVRMLQMLCSTHPATTQIYQMSCKEGLGPIEQSNFPPVLHWTFNSFARPQMVAGMDDGETFNWLDRSLAELMPAVQPTVARAAVKRFHSQWMLCRSSLELYFHQKAAL